jgi:PUA domain protein
MKLRRRHPVSSKEIKSILDSLRGILPDPQLELLVAPPVDSAVFGDLEVILSGGEAVVFLPEGKFFPTLKGFLKVKIDQRYLKVDSGAVPFVVNGADIMSPGVVDVDEVLRTGDLCVVTEERYNKPISISRMLVDSSGVDRSRKGKVAKNLHHVGDDLWNLNKE